jgi:hypothetical protein
MIVSDGQRKGVGFFRGSLAVLRGSAHAAAKVIGVSGRALAAVTARSKRTKDTDSN